MEKSKKSEAVNELAVKFAEAGLIPNYLVPNISYTYTTGTASYPMAVTNTPDLAQNARAEEYFEEQKKAIDAFLVLVGAQVRGLFHELLSMTLSAIKYEPFVITTAATELEHLLDCFTGLNFLARGDVTETARAFILEVFEKPREDYPQAQIESLLRELGQAMRNQVLEATQDYEASQERCERSW